MSPTASPLWICHCLVWPQFQPAISMTQPSSVWLSSFPLHQLMIRVRFSGATRIPQTRCPVWRLLTRCRSRRIRACNLAFDVSMASALYASKHHNVVIIDTRPRNGFDSKEISRSVTSKIYNLIMVGLHGWIYKRLWNGQTLWKFAIIHVSRAVDSSRQLEAQSQSNCQLQCIIICLFLLFGVRLV